MFKIYLILIILKITLCLKSSDICNIDNNNNKTTECNEYDSFSFKCETYCTIDEEKCKDLIRVNQSLKVLIIMPFISMNGLYEKRIKAFNTLIKNIKPCINNNNNNNNNNKEILSSKDVCLSGKNCKAKKQKLPIRYMYLNIFDLIKCPCPIHTYSYECGANYCTRDKISCERVKNGWKMNNVNKCGNENIIL